MSEIKVNKLTPRTACGTTTLGDSGDTFTIPAGVTITNSGTAAGFGATGAVSWDTTAKTTGFTAVDGVGYFVNTTAGAISVTLPLSPAAGAVIGVSDYAGTAASNNITLLRNGSKIAGLEIDSIISTAGVAVTLVYVDVTRGWLVTDSGNQSDTPLPTYITATGGTPTTSGDYKIHTFTGPGTFTVCSVGNPSGSTTITAVIVAGGGGAGSLYGGGGGGGGLVLDSDGFSVSAIGYPIVIGGGGNGPTGNCAPGTSGSNSTALGFTTIGGGQGGGGGGGGGAEAGGSGGGGGGCNGGTVTGTQPSQPNTGATNYGNPGGPGTQGGGGGGAGSIGISGPSGAGGAGLDVSPTVGPAPSIPNLGVYSAGGGGQSSGTIGAANTGDGGGGDCFGSGRGAGGSGVVVIKYKFQ